MNKILRYTSPRGKVVEFDDYEIDDDDEYIWSEICPACHNKYRFLKNKCSSGGSGVGSCGVKGCTNTNAGYYVDFAAHEVEEVSI